MMPVTAGYFSLFGSDSLVSSLLKIKAPLFLLNLIVFMALLAR
jgi:hypothetical protein